MRPALIFTLLTFFAAHTRAASVDIPGIVSELPFSFTYGGRNSQTLLSRWQKTESSRALTEGRRQRLITYTDPETHLQVTSEVTLFAHHNAAEWLLRIRNGGDRDTPIIENVRPMDIRFPVGASAPATFYHVLGSALRPVKQEKKKQAAFPCPDCADAGAGEGLARDYVPVDRQLRPSDSVRLSHYVLENGKQVESYLPFFNLQLPGGGIAGGLGWTGQWMLHAERSDHDIALQAGQETTHLTLHAGESMRTPRVLLIRWEGTDRIEGQNELRRILIAHYLPRVDGQVAMPPVAHTGAYQLIFDDIAQKTGKNPLQILPTLKQTDLGGSGRFADPGAALNFVTERNQLEVIRGLPDVGIEAYWLDAGWFQGSWPGGRGSWVPNQNFPDGLRPLADAAHARRMKFLLWFDPEGVSPNSLIAKEHPEWVLHQPKEGQWGGIFRFSDPAALRWMTELLSTRIRDWHIDIFRNDRNTNPLPFWQAADTPDRQGMTEIRQIEGFYALWDELLKGHPKLEIDNANWRVTGPDLEVMKRSIGSLTRSELTNGGIPNSVADQAETAELSLWIPLDANILNAAGTYDFRSTATTGVAIGLNLRSKYISVDELRKAVSEVKELRPYWLGDFYPLTPVTQDQSAWLGWQFNRPDLNAGYAMMFRRSQSREATKEISLHGLDPDAEYDVSFAETHDPGPKRLLKGDALAHLQVSTSSQPSSILIRYKKVGNSSRSSANRSQ